MASLVRGVFEMTKESLIRIDDESWNFRRH